MVILSKLIIYLIVNPTHKTKVYNVSIKGTMQARCTFQKVKRRALSTTTKGPCVRLNLYHMGLMNARLASTKVDVHVTKIERRQL